MQTTASLLARIAALALLAALPAAAAENPVANGGFEEPAAAGGLPAGGWWVSEGRGSLKATRDPEIYHSGSASVRLHADEETRAVLVSRRFEIAPGDQLHFEAWVRGAQLGPQPSTINAGLAFRHPDGRVLARAYFTSARLSGDWSRIAGEAVAPADAASAEVHLAYTNAPTTLWFDDVVAVVTNALSLALVEGARPWPGRQELRVRVVNRQTNAFRGDLAFSTGKAARRLPVALEPGTARVIETPIVLEGVGVHDYTLSLLDATGASLRELAGRFRVQPPLALYPACPCYHLAGQGNGDTRLDARVNVNPVDRGGLSLCLEVRDADGHAVQAVTNAVAEGESVGVNVRVPVARAGGFSLAARLVSRAGQVVGSAQTQVHVTDDPGRVSFGPDGFLRIGGASFFPIGLYNCGLYAELAQAGFNVTHNYSITTGEADAPINPNDNQLQELLDKSWANGLRMMVELPRKAIEQAKWEQVRRRIETFKHHPGLLCWGSEERVARGTAPLTNIARLYALVKELDPAHPLVLGDTRDVIQKLQKDRRNFFPDASMDAGIWWWYPIPLKEPDGNGLEGGGASADLMEPPSWLTTTLSRKPLWIAIQSYQKPSRGAEFPTPAQYRCQAYLSLINGVKGLFFYVGYGQKDYLGKPAGLLNKPREGHWEYVKQLVGELREFSREFMSSRVVGGLTVTPQNAPVECMLRESGGRLVLIAANKSARNQTVRLSSARFQGRKARTLYEEHAVALEQGALSDEFGPFAVHVYQLTAGGGS